MHSLSFITLSKDPAVSKEIREALSATSRVRVLAESQDAETLLGDTLRLRPSAVIIVLEADASEKTFSLIKKLSAAVPETAIITAANNASPALILGSMRAGAREFLQLPIIADELRTVLDHVAELCTAEGQSHKQARLAAVFSSKGGAGVSFLSANLAAAMNTSTLLVDLNLQAGDAASFMGLDPKYSLADFAANRNRLDDALISSMITAHSKNLSLLAAPREAHEADDITVQDVCEVLHLMGRRYECIVLDLPHTFDPLTIAALDLADDILLVMTMDIPGIRSTKRALKVFERLGYPRGKIRVVVNRWSKSIDVELQKVEAHLDEQLVGFVPNDYPRVIESINLGQPLVQSEPSSKLTIEIKRIASLVQGNSQANSPQPRRGLLGSVFGRSRNTGTLELSTMTETA
ncbi:MAG TPA: AAA family ATPase [Pyrinomonadaceae bacterium]|nr:AAA family ATPase [Pyrinomonadaceae bacterium]